METFSLRTRGHRGQDGLGLSLSLALNELRISEESTDSTPSPQAEKRSAPAQGEEAQGQRARHGPFPRVARTGRPWASAGSGLSFYGEETEALGSRKVTWPRSPN